MWLQASWEPSLPQGPAACAASLTPAEVQLRFWPDEVPWLDAESRDASEIST